MAKQRKKRNKTYKGADAKMTQPNVIKVEAANRNKVQQWWFEKKRIVKPVTITIIAVVLFIYFVVVLIQTIF